MKRSYFFSILLLSVFCLQAQDEIVTSSALNGSCYNPDEGTIDFIFDLNVNCPEADPNGTLPGTAEMGFHSGANNWASIIAWDDPGIPPLLNNGSDTFLLSVNVFDYYAVEFADLTDIQVVINNGFADPMDPWTISFRDSLDGESFGDPDPCSNLKFVIADSPTCSDLHQASSLAAFSDAGDAKSCVDPATGKVKIELDYALACPEGDPEMALVGASALGFHSSIDGFGTTVEWDAAGALTLANDGNDNFVRVIDVESYYGVALDDIVEITFLANDGVDNPGAAWDAAIRDPRNGGFGGNEDCSDLRLVIGEAPTCDLSVSVHDIELQHTLKVSPNPFRENTVIEFTNSNNELFNLIISDVTGKVLRTMTNISEEKILIERDNLSAGMYFATLRNQQGDFATAKLVVK